MKMVPGVLSTHASPPAVVATFKRRDLLRFSVVATTTLLVAACSSQAIGTSSGVASPAARIATASSPTAAPAAATSTTAPAAAPVVKPAVTSTTVPAATSAVATPTAVAVSSAAGVSQATMLPATAASTDARDVTPSLTEGPYFKANSPERTSLVDASTKGTKLTITGRVLSTRAQPIAKALLDFWQADAQGSYDNAGYTLRGHQFTNAEGQYQLVTVIPGLYTGRTRHIHVKAQAPNQPVLTTQIFFPNEPQNSSDSIFSPKLVLPITDAPDGTKVATFDFVLNVG